MYTMLFTNHEFRRPLAAVLSVEYHAQNVVLAVGRVESEEKERETKPIGMLWKRINDEEATEEIEDGIANMAIEANADGTVTTSVPAKHDVEDPSYSAEEECENEIILDLMNVRDSAGSFHPAESELIEVWGLNTVADVPAVRNVHEEASVAQAQENNLVQASTEDYQEEIERLWSEMKMKESHEEYDALHPVENDEGRMSYEARRQCPAPSVRRNERNLIITYCNRTPERKCEKNPSARRRCSPSRRTRSR